jgi:cobalt/nickel transport protein
MVMQEEDRTIHLTLSFSHPFDGVGMELVKPKRFFVVTGGREMDLAESLRPVQVMGHSAWKLDFPVKRPGVYAFLMEPMPYWEPAEDCFIIHYTKTVAAAFGEDAGWDAPLGVKTEIVPLSKPYGLYAGNVFQGIVQLEGESVPFAEVEVEFFNEDHRAKAPADYMITQTLKADGNGVFTYAAPKPGWWGFAALNRADFKLSREGEEKGVELGAVLWVKFEPWE